jgi:hypothetical protein
MYELTSLSGLATLTTMAYRIILIMMTMVMVLMMLMIPIFMTHRSQPAIKRPETCMMKQSPGTSIPIVFTLAA